MSVDVIVQYFDGCPSWHVTVRNLQAAADRAGLEVSLQLQRVESPEDADRLRFAGSPTILIEGHDPFAAAELTPAFACRVYRDGESLVGAPSVEQLEEALRERGDGTGHG